MAFLLKLGKEYIYKVYESASVCVIDCIYNYHDNRKKMAYAVLNILKQKNLFCIENHTALQNYNGLVIDIFGQDKCVFPEEKHLCYDPKLIFEPKVDVNTKVNPEIANLYFRKIVKLLIDVDEFKKKKLHSFAALNCYKIFKINNQIHNLEKHIPFLLLASCVKKIGDYDNQLLFLRLAHKNNERASNYKLARYYFEFEDDDLALPYILAGIKENDLLCYVLLATLITPDRTKILAKCGFESTIGLCDYIRERAINLATYLSPSLAQHQIKILKYLVEIYIERNEQVKAILTAEQLGKLGNTDGYIFLGDFYSKGIHKFETRALDYYDLALKLKNPKVFKSLVQLLLNVKCIKFDEAMTFISNASLLGDTEAFKCYCIGFISQLEKMASIFGEQDYNTEVNQETTLSYSIKLYTHLIGAIEYCEHLENGNEYNEYDIEKFGNPSPRQEPCRYTCF